MRRGATRWLLPVVLLATIAACSSKSNRPPPVKLPANPHLVRIKRVWSHDVGGGGGNQLLGLAPDASSQLVVAAAAGGNIVALNVASGRVKWRRHVHARLSGGPVIGNGLVAVGTRAGYVIALDASDGHVLWKHFVGAPVNVMPAIGNEVVVAKTIAGAVTGLSASSGDELWTQSESVPSLSLRFDTQPLVLDGVVYAGFASGKVIAFDLASGKQQWRKQVATGQGGNPIADMVGVGGVMAYAAGDLYVATYQGRLAALDTNSGQVIWSRNISSYTGVTLDAAHLYVSDAEGRVHAFDLVTGVPIWVDNKLAYRGLSAAVPYGSMVAVGDRFGYLHFLDRNKGRYLGRVQVGDGAIRMAPVVVDHRVIALDVDGTLAAYQVTRRSGKS